MGTNKLVLLQFNFFWYCKQLKSRWMLPMHASISTLFSHTALSQCSQQQYTLDIYNSMQIFTFRSFLARENLYFLSLHFHEGERNFKCKHYRETGMVQNHKISIYQTSAEKFLADNISRINLENPNCQVTHIFFDWFLASIKKFLIISEPCISLNDFILLLPSLTT